MSEGKREILPMPPHSFPLIDTFDKKCFSLHQDPSAMKAGGGPSDMTPLPDDFMPSEKDVVCSWARQNHRHGGNVRFRKLVDEHAPAYVKAETKYEKTKVIADLIDRIRNDSPDGGFVKKDFYSGRWYEIGIERARDKVGHAIRKAADKIMEKEQGAGCLKQSKGRKAVTTMKKLKAKGIMHPDSIASQDHNSAEMLSSRGPRPGSGIIDSQNMPTSFPSGTNLPPQRAYFHGMATSDEVKQQLSLPYSRNHVSESMTYTRHTSYAGVMPPNAPRGDSRSTFMAASHNDHRHHPGNIYSLSTNTFHTTGPGNRLESFSPNTSLFNQHFVGTSGTPMPPPQQYHDFSSLHSGFGRPSTARNHLHPIHNTANDPSVPLFQRSDSACIDQHFASHGVGYSSGTVAESSRQIRAYVSSPLMVAESSFSSGNVDAWDANFPQDNRERGSRSSLQRSNGEIIYHDFEGDQNVRRYSRPEG